MTFTTIQSRVADRLNLTSAQALARIGNSINEKYREVASSIGMATVERSTATATTVGNGTRLLAFTTAATGTGVQKILSVYDAAFTPPIILDELSFDQIRNDAVETDPPLEYAIATTTSASVTVMLSSACTTVFTLTADVLANMTDLSGSATPNFPEDFHDMLIYGVMAIELEKMEKYDMVAKQDEHFQSRLADLRYYIAKSAYLDIVPGRNQDIAAFRSVPLV